MWERALEAMNDDEIQGRSALLDNLSHVMASAAGDLGIINGQNCRRVCKDRLEVVNGKLQRVVVCQIICDPA